jgi:hypothetical protein
MMTDKKNYLRKALIHITIFITLAILILIIGYYFNSSDLLGLCVVVMWINIVIFGERDVYFTRKLGDK